MSEKAETYRVEVSKDTLVFSAGHFITFAGGICERIHGHNWRAKLWVEGPLDENHYVFDFIALRDDARAIVEELDHRMLLPTQSPLIHVEPLGRQVEVRFKNEVEERFWSFPADECVLLPVPNTTAELIAHWFADRLIDGWKAKGVACPAILAVGIEENFGQWAIHERRSL